MERRGEISERNFAFQKCSGFFLLRRGIRREKIQLRTIIPQ